MNNKKLLYILLGLILFFGLSQLFNRKQDRSFKSELIRVDTSKVTKIILHPQAEHHTEIIMNKENGIWTAQKGQLKVNAEPGSLSGILTELLSIKIKSIATQSKAKWQDYEISDTAGSRVQVFAGSDQVADFYSGKFGFNPQANSMISYMRPAGEDAVYSVDGFQSMTFNPSFSNFRDKTISSFRSDQCQSVTIQSNQISSSLTKSGSQWSLNGIAIADSLAVTNYLNSIQNLRGVEFIESFSPITPIHVAKIVTNTAPIEIKLYPSGDTIKPFIINSSLNPAAYFAEDSNGVYTTLISGVSKLLTPSIKK